MKYVPKLIQIKYSNFGNFAPPYLTRPSPIHPVQVFPAPQRCCCKDGARFSLAPRGVAEMGLDFLDPHPTPPHPVPSRPVPSLSYLDKGYNYKFFIP